MGISIEVLTCLGAAWSNAMEMFDRFKVADADRVAWGQLVKGWARGEVSRPTSLDDLRMQCRDRGISINVPDYVKDIAFVQQPADVLTVRLPAPDLVEIAEMNAAESRSGYPLPSFYQQIYRSPVPNAALSREEKLDLHAARVGEYAINQCC
jgi:hypothetical protein